MIYCMALVARLSWRKLGWVAIPAEKGGVSSWSRWGGMEFLEVFLKDR